MIIPYDEVTDEMINRAIETGRDALRHSIQGEDRVILKYSGTDPECFSDYTKFTHAEIRVTVQGEDWTVQEEL